MSVYMYIQMLFKQVTSWLFNKDVVYFDIPLLLCESKSFTLVGVDSTTSSVMSESRVDKALLSSDEVAKTIDRHESWRE